MPSQQKKLLIIWPPTKSRAGSEEKLLLELWKVGSKEERHRLAHMLVKLARH
ncbi:hypothetical protein D3C74_489760 [compost metagenome]